MNIKDYPLVLKAPQVAEILNVSVPTVYRYMRQEGFPSVKMKGRQAAVRVMRDALYAWLIEQSGEKGA